MADHPLRPANDRRLGRQLPHQLANRTQAPPQAPLRALDLGHYAVLAVVSHGCPPPKDRYLRVTHPSATARSCPRTVRLACVKHAASVRSEPGSNSQVHLSPAPKGRTSTNRPGSHMVLLPNPSRDQTKPSKRCLTIKKISQPTPSSPNQPNQGSSQRAQNPNCPNQVRVPCRSAQNTRGRRQRIPS